MNAAEAKAQAQAQAQAQAESMMRRESIRWLLTTTKSIVETATTILQEISPERLSY